MAKSPQPSHRITVLAASDWLYHGTTETLENPALGLNMEVNLGKGFFIGAEAHQAIENEERQRQRSAMAYLGTTLSTRAQWIITPSISFRDFPGSVKDWQFVELSIDLLSPTGVGLRMDYSPDYYDHDTRSFAAEGRYLQAINHSRHYWFVKAGLVELSNTVWNDHVYAQAGLGSSFGSTNVELTAHWNNQGDDQSFGREPYSDPGLVLRIAYRLR